MSNLHVAVSNLRHGYLSTTLIPVKNLQLVLNEVTVILGKDYLGYELLHDTAMTYYTHSSFVAVRRNEVLYVTLNIPVVHTSSVLTVHKIKTHPVLMHEDSSHGTVLGNVADYIGLSRDKRHYAVFSEQQYHDCHPGNPRECLMDFSLLESSQISCELALLLHMKDSVKKQCSFDVFSVKNYPVISPIFNEEVLLLNANNVQQICKNRPNQLHNCGYCVVRLLCHCQLVSSVSFLPAKIKDCENSSVSSTLYPSNLILIQSLMNEIDHSAINPDTLFHKPQKYDWQRLDGLNQSMFQFSKSGKIRENLNSILHQSYKLEGQLSDDHYVQDAVGCSCNNVFIISVVALVIATVSMSFNLIYVFFFIKVDTEFEKLLAPAAKGPERSSSVIDVVDMRPTSELPVLDSIDSA